MLILRGATADWGLDGISASFSASRSIENGANPKGFLGDGVLKNGLSAGISTVCAPSSSIMTARFAEIGTVSSHSSKTDLITGMDSDAELGRESQESPGVSGGLSDG